MITKAEIGSDGEERAVAYLESEGYVILERNWRVGHKEVDIICTDGKCVVVVEVKTRREGTEYPAELMDRKKKHNLLAAGAAYLQRYKLQKELRFDLILVNVECGSVEHFPEAIQVFD